MKKEDISEDNAKELVDKPWYSGTFEEFQNRSYK